MKYLRYITLSALMFAVLASPLATFAASEATITKSTLSTTSTKPTLKGTAQDSKTVQVVITKEGSSKVVFKSKAIKVKKDKWQAKVTKKLANGTYDVTVYGAKGTKGDKLATETLTIGSKKTSKSTKDAKDEKPPSSSGDANTSSLSVSLIPLLAGGNTRSGATVPVTYLKIVNTGTATATFTGVTLKQAGTASAAKIVGLTISDDKNGSKGSVGAAGGVSPFKNGIATVTTKSTLAPGEMRLYTIKAIIAGNVSTDIGKTLQLDVVGLSGSSKGKYPIRGATWVLGL